MGIASRPGLGPNGCPLHVPSILSSGTAQGLRGEGGTEEGLGSHTRAATRKKDVVTSS